MEFKGYAQLRSTTNYKDNAEFSLRRLKLWIKSAPTFSDHWNYKIQTTIKSSNVEFFFCKM